MNVFLAVKVIPRTARALLVVKKITGSLQEVNRKLKRNIEKLNRKFLITNKQF